MKYLDYRGIKEYHTIAEVCRLFEISKQELKHYADKYSIQPQEDQYGKWWFARFWCVSCTISSTRSSIISLALRRSPIRGRTRGHEK